MNCLRNHSPHIEGPIGCVYCHMEGLHRDANKQAAIKAELLEALQALLNDVGKDSSMLGAVKARAAINKATGELK